MSNSLTLTRRNCGQYIEKNMELPQNCRAISAETFFNRPDIRSVVFPYEMEQIGNKAFQGCSRLSRIELPEHLQDRKSTRLNSSHPTTSRMPSSA